MSMLAIGSLLRLMMMRTALAEVLVSHSSCTNLLGPTAHSLQQKGHSVQTIDRIGPGCCIVGDLSWQESQMVVYQQQVQLSLHLEYPM